MKSIKLVTAKGCGTKLVEELYKIGILMADLHHARGSVVGGPVRKDGQPVESELEIINCLVDESKAEEVFSHIYEFAEVGKPGGGFLTMESIGKSTSFVLPREQSPA